MFEGHELSNKPETSYTPLLLLGLLNYYLTLTAHRVDDYIGKAPKMKCIRLKSVPKVYVYSEPVHVAFSGDRP